MLQGTRLDYVVPGYTGHISCVQGTRQQLISKEKPRYEIPGYAGYIRSLKPENLHANTFGRTTYNISNQDFIRGQDIPPEHKYVSTNTETYIAPKSMIQRTAADIVGVPNTKTIIKEPIISKQGPQTDQFTLTRSWKVEEKEKPLGRPDILVQKDGEPLPGYTGFNRRVFAGNIFGQTYANSRRTAEKDLKHVEKTLTQTFTSGMNAKPVIKP